MFGQGQNSASLRNFLFCIFVILISSSWRLSSRWLLLPPYWPLRSQYTFVVCLFENLLFGWAMVRALFVFGAPLPLHLPHASQMSERELAMFLLYEVSHSRSLTSPFYIDVVEYRHWRPFTFVFGTEGLVTLLNVHASPRSLRNMLARLLVFARLVPGMFRLAWRLIRVRLRLASTHVSFGHTGWGARLLTISHAMCLVSNKVASN